MDSENKFWLIFWSILTSSICILITIISIYYTNKHSQIINLINKSMDPIAVSCALSSTKSETCRLFIIQQNKR